MVSQVWVPASAVIILAVKLFLLFLAALKVLVCACRHNTLLAENIVIITLEDLDPIVFGVSVYGGSNIAQNLSDYRRWSLRL